MARAQEARAQEARAEEPRAEVARAQEARAQEARAEEARAEVARAQEARAQEARAEEARAQEARAQEARGQDTGSAGREGGMTPVSQASPPAEIAGPPQPQTGESAVASKAEKALEARDTAAHIPLSVKTGEVEGVAVTPDGPPEPRLAAAMQAELARLGCYSGRQDNIWGGATRKAVRQFNRVAKRELRSAAPSIESLYALKDIREPLCGSPQKQENKGEEQSNKARGLGQRRETHSGDQDSGPSSGPDFSGRRGLQAGAAKPASEHNGSYLPPWMQGSEMANVQAEYVSG